MNVNLEVDLEDHRHLWIVICPEDRHESVTSRATQLVQICLSIWMTLSVSATADQGHHTVIQEEIPEDISER